VLVRVVVVREVDECDELLLFLHSISEHETFHDVYSVFA